MKAIRNGTNVGESNDAVEDEGNPFFALASLKRPFVQGCGVGSVCAGRGVQVVA